MNKSKNEQAYSDLQQFFQTTDNIFIKVCMAQARLEDKISQEEYQDFLNVPTADKEAKKDSVYDLIGRAKCKPLWNSYDLKQYLMQQANQ